MMQTEHSYRIVFILQLQPPAIFLFIEEILAGPIRHAGVYVCGRKMVFTRLRPLPAALGVTGP